MLRVIKEKDSHTNTELSVLSIRAHAHRRRSQRAHIQGEKRKKGRTGIEPAAKAEPLPALSAVLHKSKCGDHLLRVRAKSPLGVRRPTPKLPPSTHSSTLGWMREGLLPEFDQVLSAPPAPLPGLSLVRTSEVARTEIKK